MARQRFEFTAPQMGVPFRVVLYGTNAGQAGQAARAAFERIGQLNDILSDYDTDSELSRLSHTSGEGRFIPVSPDLWTVLDRSQRLAEKTGGAFDVTIGPVVSLWRKARREKALPPPDRLDGARRRVGWRHLRLDAARHAAQLILGDMRLDLGGIAKGYAIDEALKVLATNGIDSALVSGGGDLAVSAPPPGQRAWRIELPALDVTNAPPVSFVTLRHAALATSGDIFQNVEIGGRRYSHIVDPRTGLGLVDHSLVRVIARDCTTADSWATAISVLGPERGIRRSRSARGVEAQVSRAPDGRLEQAASRGFRRFLDGNGARPAGAD